MQAFISISPGYPGSAADLDLAGLLFSPDHEVTGVLTVVKKKFYLQGVMLHFLCTQTRGSGGMLPQRIILRPLRLFPVASDITYTLLLSHSMPVGGGGVGGGTNPSVPHLY
jgi:hypothetical protein